MNKNEHIVVIIKEKKLLTLYQKRELYKKIPSERGYVLEWVINRSSTYAVRPGAIYISTR
jgi:hypothetical protein